MNNTFLLHNVCLPRNTRSLIDRRMKTLNNGITPTRKGLLLLPHFFYMTWSRRGNVEVLKVYVSSVELFNTIL